MPVTQQLSISDPRYNLLEMVKQMLLLEQHLLEKDKYCPDCISKHILTIEALADEAQCLDKQREWCKLTQPISGRAQVWGAAFQAGAPAHKIGQDVRRIRKELAPHLVSPVRRSELSGFHHDGAGESSWKTWGLVLAGLAAGIWWSEYRRGTV